MKIKVIVEGPPGGPKGDWKEISPPAFEREIESVYDRAPDILKLSTGQYLVKVGRYAQEGENYRYNFATIQAIPA